MPTEDKIFEAPQYTILDEKTIPTGLNCVIVLNGVPDDLLFDRLIKVLIIERPVGTIEFCQLTVEKNGEQKLIDSGTAKYQKNFFSHLLNIVSVPNYPKVSSLTNKGKTGKTEKNWRIINALENMLMSAGIPNREYEIILDMSIDIVDKLFSSKKEMIQYISKHHQNNCDAIVYSVNGRWEILFSKSTEATMTIAIRYFDTQISIQIKDLIQ